MDKAEGTIEVNLLVYGNDIFMGTLSKLLLNTIAITLIFCTAGATSSSAQSESQSTKMILGHPASEVGDFNSPPKYIIGPQAVSSKWLNAPGKKLDSIESYMNDLQERIYAHWFPPEQAESKQTVVMFKLLRTVKCQIYAFCTAQATLILMMLQ